VALAGALVDRGRVVRRESTGRKVEGTTQMAPTHGPWFRARLFLQDAPERSEQGDRKKAVAMPRVMFLVTDVGGVAVDVNAEDQLEIASPELGTAVWRVTAQPAPIRKKRRVIGWEVGIERVLEPKRKGVT
jgi:hypothetical protein